MTDMANAANAWFFIDITVIKCWLVYKLVSNDKWNGLVKAGEFLDGERIGASIEFSHYVKAGGEGQ